MFKFIRFIPTSSLCTWFHLAVNALSLIRLSIVFHIPIQGHFLVGVFSIKGFFSLSHLLINFLIRIPWFIFHYYLVYLLVSMSFFTPKSRDLTWHDIYSTLAPRTVVGTLEVPGKYFFLWMNEWVNGYIP